MRKYYVAYGSNLNKDQMSWRCPNATPYVSGIVRDYELAFRGSKTGSYATIEPKQGESVQVGVWMIDEDDEQALDRYEGYPTFYYKTNVDVETELGTVNAMVYIMHKNRPYGIPSDHYLQVCYEGYDDFGLDKLAFFDAYLTAMLRAK